jgi:hypothetical protein
MPVGSTVFKNHVKYLYEEGYNTLWKMVQGPIQNTVWALCLAEL